MKNTLYSDVGTMAGLKPSASENDAPFDKCAPKQTSSHHDSGTRRPETDQDADFLPEECYIPLPTTPIRVGTPIATEPSLETLRPKNDRLPASPTTRAIQVGANEPRRLREAGMIPLNGDMMDWRHSQAPMELKHSAAQGRSDRLRVGPETSRGVPSIVRLESLWSEVHEQRSRKSAIESRLEVLGHDLLHDREGMRLGHRALQTLPVCLGAEDVQFAKPVLNDWFLWQRKRVNGGNIYPQGFEATNTKQSWFAALDPSDQRALVDITQAICATPSFLAERLCLLSPDELNKIAMPFEEPWKESASTRASSSVRSGTSLFSDSWSSSPMRTTRRHAESNGLLYTIVHDLVDSSASGVSRDGQPRIQILSEIIAQLMRLHTVEGQNVSSSILDIVSQFEEWPLKSRLSVLLQSFLREGYSVLHKDREAERDRNSSSTTLFAEREIFVHAAAHRVVDLIHDAQISSYMPAIAVELLLQQLQRARGDFEADRTLATLLEEWFVSRFLVRIIAYPETFGLLTDVYIGTHMRSKILFSIAQRVKGLMTPIWSRHDDEGQHWLVTKMKDFTVAHSKHAHVNPTPSLLGSQVVLGARESVELLDIIVTRRDAPPELFSIFHPVIMNNHPKETASSTTTQDTQNERTGMTSSSGASISGTSMTSADHHQDNTDSIHQTPDEAARFDSSLLYEIDHARISHLRSSIEALLAQNEFDIGAALINKREDTDTETVPTIHGSTLHTSDKVLLKEALENLLHCDHSAFGSGSNLGSEAMLGRFKAAVNLEKLQMLDANNFTSAYYWDHVSYVLDWTESLQGVVDTLIDDLAKQKVENAETISRAQDEIVRFEKQHATYSKQLRLLTTQIDDLRAKLLYVSDVRHSTLYTDARLLIKALRDLHQEPTSSPKTSSTWAKQRLRNITTSDQDKKAQLIERLACPSRFVRHKLSDDESSKTADWLRNNNIGVFCADDEKIHRMHYEIYLLSRALIDETISRSPVLWSSELFQIEKTDLISDKDHRLAWQSSLAPNPPRSNSVQSAPSQRTGSYQSRANIFGPAVSASPRGLAIQTSIQHPNDFKDIKNVVSPVSGTSVEVASLRDRIRDQVRALFVAKLRTKIVHLLLNDLGMILLSSQSTCDAWITRLAPVMTQDFKNGREPQGNRDPDTFFDSTADSPVLATMAQDSVKTDAGKDVLAVGKDTFDLETSYTCIIKDISAVITPAAKLARLMDLVRLVSLEFGRDAVAPRSALGHPSDWTTLVTSLPFKRYSNVARTRLDRMQDIFANCQDRLDGTLAYLQTKNKLPSERLVTAAIRTGEILTDDRYRAPNLYSDFQIMAAHLDNSILDASVEGSLFWIIGLSLLTYKAKLCSEVISYAQSIVVFHLPGARRMIELHAANPENLKRRELQRPTTDLTKTSMADAARLYTIAALEGEPRAAYELALFYMADPEFLDRVVQPFSPPNEIFRMGTNPGPKLESRNERTPAIRSAADSLSITTAIHWVDIAAGAGNTDAINFQKQNAELFRQT